LQLKRRLREKNVQSEIQCEVILSKNSELSLILGCLNRTTEKTQRNRKATQREVENSLYPQL
jgi:hypothetical protein